MKKFSFILLLICIIWQFVTSHSPHLSLFLPPPTKIILCLIHGTHQLWWHCMITLQKLIVSFLLCICCALPLAYLMSSRKKIRMFLEPTFLLIQSIPTFIIAPLIILWFGWSFIAIVIPTTLMILFPLTLNLYRGFLAVPFSMQLLFQSYQATSWQTLTRLQFPYALPHFFSGLRLCSTLAVTAVIACEWMIADQGLGILMLESRRDFDVELIFATIIVTCGLTALLYTITLALEKITISHTSLLAKRSTYCITLLTVLAIMASSFYIHSPSVTLLLDWLPNPNHIPLYVGIEKGFFKAVHIPLKLKKLTDSMSSIPHVMSGNSDLALYYLPAVLKAYTKKTAITIVSSFIKVPLRALIANGKDHNISDLSTANVGYCMSHANRRFLEYLLTQAHIQPKKIIAVPCDLIGAMVNHTVDVIYGGFWNIEPFQLESLHLPTTCFRVEELGVPAYPEMVIIARQNSVCASQHFIQQFQKALQDSIDYCYNYPQEAFEIYAKLNCNKRCKTIAWERKAWEVTLPLYAVKLDLEQVNHFYQWLYDLQLVNERLSLQQLYTAF